MLCPTSEDPVPVNKHQYQYNDDENRHDCDNACTAASTAIIIGHKTILLLFEGNNSEGFD
jgi:hypothetical protein